MDKINKLEQVFTQKPKDILNIYFTCGYPTKSSTADILAQLESSDVDIIELGIPYSDPLADGLTIQQSSKVALENGTTLESIIADLKNLELNPSKALVMMGYLNQFIQYDINKLLKDLNQANIDALIIPDLPPELYLRDYKGLFEANNIKIAFLITPETPDDRIRMIDELNCGFIYVVSRSGLTGGAVEESDLQKSYFKRIDKMDLKTPRLIGFGIHDKSSFKNACQYANGAIIGSAFIRHLGSSGTEDIHSFIDGILG